MSVSEQQIAGALMTHEIARLTRENAELRARMEITDAMVERAKAAAAEQISEGLGAILRKFCDSAKAGKARAALHAMPENEWGILVNMLAEESSRAALTAALHGEGE